MQRIRLSTLLITANVGLLLLALAGVAFVAGGLLQRLADEQALARVEQAGSSAQQFVARSGRELVTSALLLSERPTLRRLVQQDDRAALAPFLEQFRQTSALDGCAVLLDGELLGTAGVAMPWLELLAIWPQAEPGLFLPGTGPPLLGSRAAIPDLPGGVVLVAQQLDEPFAAQISSEVGLAVTIVPASALEQPAERGALLQRARLEQRLVVQRLDSAELYLAVVPLRNQTGEILALAEVALPSTGIARSLRELIETLLLLTIAVAGIAVLVSLLLSRRLSRPLQTLTSAAERIGGGDLATPILLAPGVEIGTLSLTLEEMRRRLLELTANLRLKQAESEAILTGIVEGVFSVDRERRIRYINPQAAAMLGLPAEQALGRFCGDVLRPLEQHGVRPCEQQCPILHARFRGGTRAIEHLQLASGQRSTVVVTSAPPSDDLQIQVLRDETELEATRRLRDTVLANISHEFRTPLSAQLASIELLLDQLPMLTLEQLGQLIVSLQRGTLRLTWLIDNLLESVRIEAGQDAIRRQRVSIDEVVEGALELTRPLLDQREQVLVLELPYPLPSISGDTSRLIQVFVNLLANASKFAPERSTITIAGKLEERSVQIWVEDRGPGLPKLSGQSLFSRFVRSSGEEPEQSGAGLGLWIVQSIVHRHGGRVDAQSTGSGTRMVVTLPQEHTHEDTRR